MRVRERTVFLGPVVPDRMHPHDRSLIGQLHRRRHDRDLQRLAGQAFPARYIVPAKDTDPVLSAIRVTVSPVLGFRAVRRPCTGGLGSWSGLRRCTWEATNTSR